MDWKLSCIVLLAVATVCSAQGYGVTCSYGGVTYQPGPFQYKCHECTCSRRGVVSCPATPCYNDCVHNGVTIPHGGTYKDKCNDCTCHDGAGSCTRMGCLPTPGQCPESSSQQCSSSYRSCTDDWDCDKPQKCCCGAGKNMPGKCVTPLKPCLYNGQIIPSGGEYTVDCNSCTCMDGVGACSKIGCIPYVGLCPKMVDSGVCAKATKVCYDDWYCARNEKCCNCGGSVRKCVPAVSPPERPGFCPKTASGVAGTCHEDCYYDQECKKGFKCCSNGCGHTCVLPLFECKLIQEPKYTTITYSTIGILVTGTIASYTCHPGYTLSVYGVDSQTCSIDGQWVGVMPICVPVVCEYLPNIKYGQVMYTGTILIPGAVATLNCNEGYISDGVTKLTCGENGQWNGIFTCVQVMCPKLNYIINGGVKLTGTTPGSTAAYYCNQGYTLDSLTKRTCGITGHWSGTEPTCIQVDCGEPMGISYGTVKYLSTIFGSTATYMCLEGYILVGVVNTRTCEASGYWSKENIVCKQVDCGVPDEVMYGTVEFTTTTYGSVASYTCNQGYYCVGIYTTKCEINGRWIGELPVCKGNRSFP